MLTKNYRPLMLTEALNKLNRGEYIIDGILYRFSTLQGHFYNVELREEVTCPVILKKLNELRGEQ